MPTSSGYLAERLIRSSADILVALKASHVKLLNAKQRRDQYRIDLTQAQQDVEQAACEIEELGRVLLEAAAAEAEITGG